MPYKAFGDETEMDTPTPDKPTILFVDDEENVLLGLKRMLRGRRNEWDMAFAGGGQEALEYQSENPAAVIVSDMRMPGMDGAALLSRVRELHPHTLRIILSGFADKEAILQTIGPSHRYLAKPCDADTLANAIESSLKLRAGLRDSEMQQALTRMTHVPTLPQIYADVLSELSAEFGSPEGLAEKIEKDIGLTAQLLKLTNSAYFSLPAKCVTVRQAINFLGFDNIRATILMAGVFEQFKTISPSLRRTVEVLTSRSLSIAVLAQQICRLEKQPGQIADQAYCAGILAHVGTLVLIANRPEDFTATMARIDRDHLEFLEAEKAAFGATHGQLGGYLLGLWGFNDAVIEAVVHHHQPSAYALKPAPVLTAVHVAQYLSKFGKAGAPATRIAGLDTDYLENGGLASRIAAWHELFNTISKDWPHD